MYNKSQKLLEKLEIKEYLDEDEILKLHNLSKSSNADVRRIVAKLLGVHYHIKNEDILIKLTYDKDIIVKLEAVDSLSVGKTKKCLDILSKFLFDDDEIVRFFAVQSYIDVYLQVNGTSKSEINKLIVFFEEFEKNEISELVIIAIKKCQYILGQRDAIEFLFKHLIVSIKTQDNHLISPLINVIDEIIDAKDIKRFKCMIEPYIANLSITQAETVLEICNI